MKITKSQLRQIIKEELEMVFETEKRNPDILTPEEIEDLLNPDILSKEEIAGLLQQIQSDPSYADVEPLSGEEIADYQYKNPALRRAWRKALANW